MNLFSDWIYTQSLSTKPIISYSSTDTKYVLINQSAASGQMQMKWNQSGQVHLIFLSFSFIKKYSFVLTAVP